MTTTKKPPTLAARDLPKIHIHAQLNHPACGCPEGASVIGGVVLTFWVHRADCPRYRITIATATYLDKVDLPGKKTRKR